jgi:hydrogenase-4 membrane subunit HyfE
MPINRTLKTHILTPIAIYALISIEVAAIVATGNQSDQLWVWTATTALLTALLIGFTVKYAKPSGVKAGAKLGLAWTAIFMLLDVLIVAVPFTGFSYFADWRVYTPYLLGFLIPALIGIRRPESSPA